MDLTLLQAYDYKLPRELIAQYPCAKRDASRLMIVDRKAQTIIEKPFYELSDLLQSGDALIFNDTKVMPARLNGKRESGGSTEILLLEEMGENRWKALAKPAKKLQKGAKIYFSSVFFCTVMEKAENGIVEVLFSCNTDFFQSLREYGKLALPHYIRRPYDNSFDLSRYQTVYAKQLGACAAPTAGLHFTNELLQNLQAKGVEHYYLTLHVGLGTFQPVVKEDIREHKMHKECYMITDTVAKGLNAKKECRRICVGTTCCRTLESAANEKKEITPGNSATDIFIYPGYQFKYVDHMLTNFHLPKSTLLMLVCAFAGYELTMEAYKKAIKEGFRFFSYGDAMLIL